MYLVYNRIKTLSGTLGCYEQIHISFDGVDVDVEQMLDNILITY